MGDKELIKINYQKNSWMIYMNRLVIILIYYHLPIPLTLSMLKKILTVGQKQNHQLQIYIHDLYNGLFFPVT